MKLTESKLKQMIMEALRNSKFQDFGIPTPDEKLRSHLGDEMFDKIQNLDKQQSNLMKQTFDPDYPEDIEQQTFADLLAPYGLELFRKRTILDNGYQGSYRFETYKRGLITFYVRYKVIYSRRDKKSYIEYVIEIWDEAIADANIGERGYIEIPDMFELDVRSDDDSQTMVSLIINRTGKQIIKALEEKNT